MIKAASKRSNNSRLHSITSYGSSDRVGPKIDECVPLGFNTSSSLPAETSTRCYSQHVNNTDITTTKWIVSDNWPQTGLEPRGEPSYKVSFVAGGPFFSEKQHQPTKLNGTDWRMKTNWFEVSKCTAICSEKSRSVSFGCATGYKCHFKRVEL